MKRSWRRFALLSLLVWLATGCGAPPTSSPPPGAAVWDTATWDDATWQP